MLREKVEILEHHQSFIIFVQNLKALDESQLRKPIAENKWSIIEIIGHFHPWDEFVLRYRIPHLLTGECLPKGPKADDLNTQSSFLARTESVENTFQKCISIRKELLNMLRQIPEDNWFIELQINQSNLKLYEYLKGLMEHDLHHINQIQSSI